MIRMGVILSEPRSKEAFLRSQAEKARRIAKEARAVGDIKEVAKQEDVAKRAEDAANATNAQLEDRLK